LANSLANIGYTAGDNFLAVGISQAIGTTPANINIPASATNSAANYGDVVPAANRALSRAIQSDARLLV
jgi:hypothetical protein